MQFLIYQTVSIFLSILEVLIWARVLMSWFRPRYRTSSNSWFFTIEDYVWRATEPMLAPIRNILPDMGMIDFSPFVLMILLALVRRLVGTLIFGPLL
ncbi:YggT family protein [Symbiobacterium thermophilum]|uniref:YggT family protein n=1 Tax=Symbiobacterium thermophilum TaxID=2734 RepID=A0A953I5L5_SYMTR|nr:YggT family protein [Symbiobacterium thermophilum]MBY6274888.1 YggT family protein [Symbiobacterium thermophilum]